MKKILLIVICFFILNIEGVKADTVRLAKCIDGDTANFIIGTEETKVRFLAIDTPETKHPTKGTEPYGKDASNFTCNALTNANKIEIEYNENSSKKDKYDRSLGWIFVDGKLLQSELIKNGLAKVAYLYDDYEYTNHLQKLEKEAKKNKLGIWGEYKEDYTKYFATGIFIIIVIVYFIIDKKYRKRSLNKIKRTANKNINKEITKLLKQKKSKH